MIDCTAIKEAITKTFNKFTFALVIFWIVVGVTLCIAFAELVSSESVYDIQCVTGNNRHSYSIHRMCYDVYRMQNHQLGISTYLFVILNVLLIPTVRVSYSHYAKSTVNELERNPQDAQGQPRNRRRNLFMAYLCQLIISIVLEMTFIFFLKSPILYSSNFPSNFSCSLVNSRSVNGTQSTTLFNCSNLRAFYKNIWMEVVAATNGIFAFFAFLEIMWILSRGRHGKQFMENWRFYADHLKWNLDDQRQAEPEGIALVEPQHRAITAMTWEDAQPQRDFQSAIHTLKENCLQGTEQPSDLKQPFQRPNPDKGDSHHLTMDKIHVAIHEGRAPHQFVKDLDRLKQLEEYPPDEKDCQFAKPEHVIDMEHKNVLVIGHPGVGKTSWSTMMLRLWASGEVFEVFNVVLLVKFWRFNDYGKLSLRELLARAETVQRLDDSVWHVIKTESTKVLLIFDGMDKYSRKEDIKAQKDDPTYKYDVEEKMPVSVLYNKLVAGEFLRGASIITTTRPTAVKYVAHVSFQRTVKIRGFTSKNVEDCVEKFTQGVPGAKEKMWGHIKSNIYIFSFCYIPMNCFLICHCLLQMILDESSQELPTTITEIYKMAINMFFFCHNSTLKYKPFELQEMLSSLEKIAFQGIEEGRLFFESNEVCGLEDCGLLHKLPDEQPSLLSDREPKSQFCFTHLTVQEFFAAKYLVDTMSKEKIARFVHNHINVGTWQVVLVFLAGLLKSSSSDIFMKLLPKLTEKKENPLSSEGEKLIFWPKKDKHLAVKVCKYLYEITNVQQSELRNKIEKINFNTVDLSNCSLTPIDLAAVLNFLENAEKVLHIKFCSSELGDLSAKDVNKFIIKRECKLKCLNLSKNKFTYKAVEDLVDALKRSKCELERLNLSDNKLKLTEEGSQCLINAGRQSNCKVII
ncbi:PREDICTED: protein NLRC5-like [Acropora digitifera]|uniref:protein NLRC5-like n=1 Tax=Acropora digitifera TaxID=70779 RepID=UPI00077A93C8|nr:PREDICTED: protein NLRC5-like [Acropora digitifera]